MQTVDFHLAQAWLQCRGLDLSTQGFYILPEVAGAWELRLPPSPTGRVALARDLTAISGTWVQGFQGGLCWLREWDRWTADLEAVGYALLMALRGTGDDRRELRERPGVLFEAGEQLQCAACLGLAMLFEWDACYAPALGDFWVFSGHDGYVLVFCRTAQRYQEMGRFLAHWQTSAARESAYARVTAGY